MKYKCNGQSSDAWNKSKGVDPMATKPSSGYWASTKFPGTKGGVPTTEKRTAG